MMSRLFQAIAVQMGWTTDYSPARPAPSRGSLPLSAVAAPAGRATIEKTAGQGGRRRSLLHLSQAGVGDGLWTARVLASKARPGRLARRD
jgi:hypothetical protein